MKKIFEVNDRLLCGGRVNVFYGTGEKSRERMQALISQGIRCDYIGDNKEEVWNTLVKGRRCMSHDEMKGRSEINLIIGSKIYEKEIEARMLGLGILSDQIFYDNYTEELSDMIVFGCEE